MNTRNILFVFCILCSYTMLGQETLSIKSVEYHPFTLPSQDYIASYDIADFNKDNYWDVALAKFSNNGLTIAIKLNEQDTSQFSLAKIDSIPDLSLHFESIKHPSFITLSDLDNDGDDDILVSEVAGFNIEAQIHLIENTSTDVLSFELRHDLTFKTEFVMCTVSTLDIDSNGFEDILVSDFDGRLTIYENQGNFLFQQSRHNYNLDEFVSSTSFAKFDNSNVIIAYNFESDFHYFKQDALTPNSFVRDTTIFILGNPDSVRTKFYSPRIGDWNDDGFVDVFLSSISFSQAKGYYTDNWLLKGARDSSKLNIYGRIYQLDNRPLDSVLVYCTSQPVFQTNNTGKYRFTNQEFDRDYSIEPVRATNFSDGVTIEDVVLVQSHTLGILPFHSPYQYIAADVDGSQSIDILDMGAIQELVLKRIDEFPNATPSWSFISKYHQFSDPSNPWADTIPEQRFFPLLKSDKNYIDFYAIKMGDIDTSGRYNIEHRSQEYLLAHNQYFERGDVVTFSLFTDNLLGFQGDLFFNTNYLELLPSEDETSKFINDDNALKGDISVAWYETKSNRQEREPILRFKFKAIKSGDLKSHITFGSSRIPKLAIAKNYTEHSVALHFKEAVDEKLTVFAARPNPFSEMATIPFKLAKDGKVKFSVIDSNGRIIIKQKRQLNVGFHHWDILASELHSKGIYIYTIQFGNEIKSAKIAFQ